MSLPTLLQSSNRFTQAIYRGRPSIAAVPLTRNINTTAPLTGGGNLSSDLTLGLTTTPPSDTTAVGWSRALTTTAPLHVNAGLSATLHNDVAFTIDPFSGTADGIVTHNPAGVQGKFLKDDNTWGTGAAGGVTSIIAGTAIGISPASGLGDVTINVLQTGASNPGYVPSIGSADPTMFLCKTNPPTWAVPGAAGFVLLQGSFPPVTDQVGNVRVTGRIGADTGFVAGGGTTIVQTGTYVANRTTAVNPDYEAVVADNTNAGNGPFYAAYRSRGTLTSPSTTQNNDILGLWAAFGYNTSGFVGNLATGMAVYADGNAGVGNQSTYLDLIAGNLGQIGQIRIAPAGILIKPGTAIAQSDRPLSQFEVQNGTIGLHGITKNTGNFTVDGTRYVWRVDCTTNSTQVSLPDAASFANRFYTIMRVDDTEHTCTIVATPRLINGGSAISLNTFGDSATFHSDGTNWWVHSLDLSLGVAGTRQDGTSVGASSLAENTSQSVVFTPQIVPGTVIALRFRAVYSSSGTPGLQITIRDDGSSVIRVQYPSFNTPNNASNYIIEGDAEWICRTVVAGSATLALLKTDFRYADNLGATTSLMPTSSATITTSATSQTQWDINATFGASNAGNHFQVKEAYVTVTPYCQPN